MTSSWRTVLVCSIVLLFCLSPIAHPELDVSTSQAILAGVRAHYAKICSCAIVSRFKATQAGKIVKTGAQTSRLDMRNGQPGIPARYYFDRVSEEGTFKERKVVAFNGELQKTMAAHLELEQIAYMGTVRNGPSPEQDAWQNAVFPAWWWPLETVLADAEVSGPEEHNGRKVYAISAYCGPPDSSVREKNVRFLVDPERDFALTFSQWMRPDGTPSETVEVSDFVENDGTWWPTACEKWVYYSKTPTKIEDKIEYGAFNPVFSAEDFDIVWPPGTFVRDYVNALEFEVPSVRENLQAREAVLDELLAAVRQKESAADTLPAADRAAAATVQGGIASLASERSRSVVIWLLAAAMASALICAVFALLRSRKMARKRRA